MSNSIFIRGINGICKKHVFKNKTEIAAFKNYSSTWLAFLYIEILCTSLILFTFVYYYSLPNRNIFSRPLHEQCVIKCMHIYRLKIIADNMQHPHSSQNKRHFPLVKLRFINKMYTHPTCEISASSHKSNHNTVVTVSFITIITQD